MRNRKLNQRPPQFRLDAGHPLANGLVFAGLGNKAGSLTCYDSAPHKNNGTLTGMTGQKFVWVPEINRYGLDFSGSSDCVALSSSPIGTSTTWTLSWWNIGAGMALGDKDSGVFNFIWCNEANYFRLFAANTLIKDFAITSFSNWTHFAVSCDGSTATVYQNGLYVDNAACAGKSFSLKNIGAGYADYTYEHSGKIGDVLVWKRSLSAAEASLLADPSNVLLSGLIVPPRRRMFRGPVTGGGDSYSASASESSSISQSTSPSASSSRSASSSVSQSFSPSLSASLSTSLSASATGSTSPSPSVSESTSESSSFSESLSASSSESSSESSEDTTMVLTVEIVRSDILERIGQEATLTVGGNQQRRRMKATTSETEVAIQSGSLAGLCYVWHDDADTTATYLDIGYSTGDYSHRLLPGECGLIPLSGTPASLFIVSDDDTYFEYEISERTIDIVGT